MLDANGIQAENRFVIPETGLVDGYLPDDIFQPIRDWLEDTAKRTDRRVAVLSQTMAGMLDTFKTRVPRLAAHVDAQVVLRTRLRREAETAYSTALGEFDEGTRGGRLLAGEVLARWQDYAASGDLGAALRGKRTIAPVRRGGRRARADAGAARYAALDAALRAALQSLVVSVADRAAEQVARVWRDNPGGAALIAAAEASRVRDERAKREFESAFGDRPGRPVAGQARVPSTAPRPIFRCASPARSARGRISSCGFVLRRGELAHPPGRVRRKGNGNGHAVFRREQAGRPGERDHAGRAARPAQPGGAASPRRRSAAGRGARARSARCRRRLLASLIGPAESAALLARARQDLDQRVGLLLDEEMLRFGEVIDEAGPIDSVAAVRLYQAEYSLEAAR